MLNAALYTSAGAPTYKVVTAPTEYPVTLAELKLWLRITNTAQDTLLYSIIKGVTRRAEQHTKRTFINTEFVTNRDFFGNYSNDYVSAYPYEFFSTLSQSPIELRRTPLSSITSIKYFNTSNVQTTIDSADYYFTTTDGSTFSNILPEIDKTWPDDLQTQKLQQVEIIFTAGWADADEFEEQWPDLHEALLAHMADVYVNRGDCSSDAVSSACGCSFAPASSRSVYDSYRIIDFAA